MSRSVVEWRSKMAANPMTPPSAKDARSAGDPLPSKCAVIEVRVGELRQLFNAIDPSPFRDKDLDPKAEEFIVGWAKDLPRDVPLALVVDLDRQRAYPTRRPCSATPSTNFSGSGQKPIAGTCANCSVAAEPAS